MNVGATNYFLLCTKTPYSLQRLASVCAKSRKQIQVLEIEYLHGDRQLSALKSLLP